MGSKRFFFFATPEDLREPIQRVQASRSLHYAEAGNFESPEITLSNSLLDIADLGSAQKNQTLLCSRYIALPADVTLLVRRLGEVTGKTRYLVDQLINPTSLVIRPGGVFGDRFVLCGEIGTCSDDEASVELFRLFKHSFVKSFKPFESFRVYLVGPGALSRYNAGARLVTMGAEDDPSYDLKPDEGPPKEQKPRRRSQG